MAAQAANQLTRIDNLDDLLRYLTEDLGYEKYPALWEMRERIWDGQLRLTRQRHVEGKPYSPTDGKPYNREPVDPSFARSKLTLEFDSHDRVQVISRAAGFEWWDLRYLIAEGCDVRAIWPLPASQPAPEDEADPDSHTPTSEWILNEAVRMKRAGEIPEGISETDFAKLLAPNMHQAAKTDTSLRPIKWQHIRNNLRSWGAWPISSIKISDLT
jgi:hypothetical protein